MDETLARQVAALCQDLHARAWVANHDGNVSVRLGDGRFLASPTAVSKRDVRPESLVVVDGEGKVVLNSVWLQMKQAASGPPDGEGGGDDAEGAGDVPPEKADEAAAKLFGKGADEAGKGDEAGDGARGQGEGAGAPQDGAQPPPKGKTTLPVFDSALIKGERASDELARRVTTWSTRFKV